MTWGYSKKKEQAYQKTSEKLSSQHSGSIKPMTGVKPKTIAEKKVEIEEKIKKWEKVDPSMSNKEMEYHTGINLPDIRIIRGLDPTERRDYNIQWLDLKSVSNKPIKRITVFKRFPIGEDVHDEEIFSLNDTDMIQKHLDFGTFVWDDKKSMLDWLYLSNVIKDSWL